MPPGIRTLAALTPLANTAVWTVAEVLDQLSGELVEMLLQCSAAVRSVRTDGHDHWSPALALLPHPLARFYQGIEESCSRFVGNDAINGAQCALTTVRRAQQPSRLRCQCEQRQLRAFGQRREKSPGASAHLGHRRTHSQTVVDEERHIHGSLDGLQVHHSTLHATFEHRELVGNDIGNRRTIRVGEAGDEVELLLCVKRQSGSNEGQRTRDEHRDGRQRRAVGRWSVNSWRADANPSRGTRLSIDAECREISRLLHNTVMWSGAAHPRVSCRILENRESSSSLAVAQVIETVASTTMRRGPPMQRSQGPGG